jgi:hypothetical protein
MVTNALVVTIDAGMTVIENGYFYPTPRKGEISLKTFSSFL